MRVTIAPHLTQWTLAESEDHTMFTCHGPWPGTPQGKLYANGTVTIVFSPTNTAVGQFSASASCAFITWTDGPDKAAGNKWCKVGSKACGSPSPPPGPHPGIEYPPLSGGSFIGAPVPASPDPLVAYRWSEPAINAQQFQQYRRKPVRLLPASGDADWDPNFSGASTLLRDSGKTGAMVISGVGSIGFDFGSECAGWIEFDSPDLAGQLSTDVDVLLSSSEYTQPQFTTPTKSNNGGNCTLTAVATPHVPGRYQLALNPELYEGLRWGWLHARSAAETPRFKFTVTNLTAVCQVIPLNYVDHAFDANGAP
eukprot:SAG31_NODE_8005_length_1543_cov_1.380194_2_plen_310_part_00